MQPPYIFKLREKLNGHRVWIQRYFNKIPSFDLFYYVGHDPSRGVHYFRKRGTRNTVVKREKDLLLGDFKPFILKGGKDIDN